MERTLSNQPIRIILVDDHQLVRESWKMLLENNPRFNVIAECGDGHSAIEQAKRLSPDIMLVDVNMSPLNGFTITEQVLQSAPSVKVIGLSVNNQPRFADKMMKVGAHGYLTKTSTLEEINHGILEVHNGERYICEEVRKHRPSAEPK